MCAYRDWHTRGAFSRPLRLYVRSVSTRGAHVSGASTLRSPSQFSLRCAAPWYAVSPHHSMRSDLGEHHKREKGWYGTSIMDYCHSLRKKCFWNNSND